MQGPPGIKPVYINTSLAPGKTRAKVCLYDLAGPVQVILETDRAQVLKAFIRAPTGNHTEVGPSLKRGKALPSYDDPQTDIIIAS